MEGSHLLIRHFKKLPLVLNPWRQSIFIFFFTTVELSISLFRTAEAFLPERAEGGATVEEEEEAEAEYNGFSGSGDG